MNPTPLEPDTFDMPMDAAAIFGDDVGPAMSADEEKATLEKLVDLAEALQAKDKEVVEAEDVLSKLKNEADTLRHRTIPAIMDRLKMESFTLSDGSSIVVKKDIKCGLTVERKPAGLQWIRARGDDGIIKTELSLSFGKGDEVKAKEAEKVLREQGFAPEVSEGVHPQTLKSYVKERMEAGDNIPLDTFGVFEFKEAQIKLPKKKKAK